MHFPGAGIKRTIECLACFRISDGDHEWFIPFPPPIPTDITPMQKAFIKEKQDAFARNKFFPMVSYVGADFGTLFRDDVVFFLGLVACAFFQLNPAAWKRS